MAVKDTLNQWLAAGETERTIEALQFIVETSNDKQLRRDVTFHASRFNSLLKDRRNGIIDAAFYSLQLNNIRVALQDLIETLPDDATLPDNMFRPPSSSGSRPPAIDSDSRVSTPPISPNIPWMVGLALLIGSATVLVGFVPCPSPSEENIFRLLMAIGAAGVATILPGIFHLEIKNFKAGSAIGVFALVYLVNPAGVVKNDDKCNKLPFEFTISLPKDKNLPLSAQYPTLANAMLQIRLDNKWESSEVDANGDAHYRSIAGDFKNRKVAARLAARYWKLAQDSITLNGKSQALFILPDGSLSKVEGKVMDIRTGSPLSGATVEILNISTLTDANGNFILEIPLQKQTAEYVVDILLKGYKPYRGNATPATGVALRALLSK